jgi:Transposase DDE domain
LNSIPTVASELQTSLGPELDAIGRKTKVIQRQRKFSGATLFRTMVLTLMKSPRATTDDFVATAAQLGVEVTPEGVEKRFTDKLLGFLRAGLEHVLGHLVAVDPAGIPLLQRFTAVEIGDSTNVTLPDEYAAEFPGCGGKSGSGKAAVKIQVRWELITGKLTRLLVEPGRCSDGQNEAAEGPVMAGSLIIRDLGYFCLSWFRRLGAGGAYWISRWQQGTTVSDTEGRPLELREYVRGARGGGPIDRPIVLGSTERLACRLIVLRVPQEMANRRRQEAYEKARRHGRTPSREHLAWCDWTIFVTNAPAELLSWKEVVVLYRVRWQIELMFKLWKSHNRLDVSRETWSAVERMAAFWAKLIGVVLQHWLLLRSTWFDPRRSHWKAARVIRQWIVSLTDALADIDQLIGVLEKMTVTIRAVAKQKLQRKRPRSFQLLLNPELLDWNGVVARRALGIR